MKKTGIVLGIFAMILIFSSCKTTTEALTMIGSWKIDSYYSNGADQTTAFKATYTNYGISFDASGNYIETYTTLGVNVTSAGPWVLINAGSDLQLTNRADNSIRVLHIIEIKTSSSKVSESNGTKEYHLLKN